MDDMRWSGLRLSGLVTRILDADGDVDMPRMEKIMITTGSLQVTFDRALICLLTH
ncbi:copper homeostasis protein CutC [Shigella flexneri]